MYLSVNFFCREKSKTPVKQKEFPRVYFFLAQQQEFPWVSFSLFLTKKVSFSVFFFGGTAKYRPPELTGVAVGLISGLAALIVILVAVFAITALFVKRKRLLKQAQKPQKKQ